MVEGIGLDRLEGKGSVRRRVEGKGWEMAGWERRRVGGSEGGRAFFTMKGRRGREAKDGGEGSAILVVVIIEMGDIKGIFNDRDSS